jgi:hypothetical protein
MHTIEKYNLKRDIKTFYVTSTSFPEGISDAFKKLRALLPKSTERFFFGISCPNEKGEIIYLAAVEEFYDGEGEELNCPSLILKQGNYLSCMIENYESKMESIGAMFATILKHPNIDPHGYCVEMYLGDKDVRCAVRLKN